MIAVQTPRIKTGPFFFGDGRPEKAEVRNLWQPNPDKDGAHNPQYLALKSNADELFYGGAAGGGKTFFLLGLAATKHTKSVIFRRVYPNLKEIIRKSYDILDGVGVYNKTDKEWRFYDKSIEFGAVQYEDDKKNWQGRDHDLKGFDEITEFTRSQYQFIIGWNRSTNPKQRCRVVVTGNPPTDEAGSWVVTEWEPWLNPDFPNPATPGELRWYYYHDERPVWLESGDPVKVDGEEIYPRSRTFISARLDDNPHLSSDNSYKSVLQSLPEPLRSQLLHGDFTAAGKADPWQVIPTAWVKLAQKRWLEREKPDMPCSGVGVDVARGGIDKLAISKRYGTWFDELIAVPGVNVEDGPKAAGIVYNELSPESHIGYINIDVVGVGTSPYDSLKAIFPGKVIPVNAGSKSDYEVKKDEEWQSPTILKMRNMRAEYHWRMRQALDPVHGENIALPPGPDIVADLCAARWKPMAGGVVQIEDKDEIKKRLGRSPDVGEAIMLANLPEQSPWRSVEFLKV